MTGRRSASWTANSILNVLCTMRTWPQRNYFPRFRTSVFGASVKSIAHRHRATQSIALQNNEWSKVQQADSRAMNYRDSSIPGVTVLKQRVPLSGLYGMRDASPARDSPAKTRKRKKKKRKTMTLKWCMCSGCACQGHVRCRRGIPKDQPICIRARNAIGVGWKGKGTFDTLVGKQFGLLRDVLHSKVGARRMEFLRDAFAANLATVFHHWITATMGGLLRSLERTKIH